MPPDPDDQSPESPTPDPQTAPAGVSREEFSQLQVQLATIGSSLSQVLALASQAGQPAPPALPREPTDAEIQQMIEEGNVVGAIKTLAASRIDQAVRQHIEPLRNEGLAAIESLSRRVVQKDLAYYDRFKDEIEQYAGMLAPGARANPQALELAHRYVMGQHFEEIAKEREEAAVRKALAGDTPPDSSPSGGRRRGSTDNLPTVEDVAGERASRELRDSGLTPDQFAQMLHYPDWATYMKETELGDDNA